MEGGKQEVCFQNQTPLHRCSGAADGDRLGGCVSEGSSPPC